MGNINMARPVFVHIVLLSVLIISVNCQLNQMCFHNKEQKLGKCVLLRNCPQAIEILNSDELPQTCGFDKGHPIVCCPEKKETSVGPRADGETTVPSSSNSKTLRKCDEYSAALKNLISDNPNTNIIGGENASLGEFPHMAALGYGNLDNIQWSCGGTLISDRFVMTAGHCLKGVLGDVKFVQLGDVRLDGDSGTHKDYLVSERYPHPEYKPPATYHDIGLIRLNQRVIFNVNIKPACLFTEPNFKSVEKYSFQATGWGLTQYLGSPSNILQKVTLQLSEDCNNKYEPNARRLPTGINSRAQFCAGSLLGNDTCTGDSGGPLQIWYFDKRLYCAVGITSFGKVCGTPGLPAVYTRIASYTPWIESIVWPND